MAGDEKTSGDSRSYALPLRLNFSWTFVGNVVWAVSQWGMLKVLAKIEPSEGVMVGCFARGLAIATPVVVFAGLQLRAVQATDAKREYRFADYMGLMTINSVLALVVILGIVLCFGYQGEAALVIIFVGIAKIFETLSEIIFGLLQQHERMDHIAKSMMTKGIMSLVVMGTLAYLTHSVLWGAAGMAVVLFLRFIGYDARCAANLLKQYPQAPEADQPSADSGWSQLRPRWDSGTLLRLAWLALPMGCVATLISLNTNIPRYFVEGYMGEGALGVYSALAYVAIAGNTVVNALAHAATPRLAQYYAAGRLPAFYRLTWIVTGISLAMSIASVLVVGLFGGTVLKLLYAEQYAKYTDAFMWSTLVGCLYFIGTPLAAATNAKRMFRIQVPIHVGKIIVISALCPYLIPKYGLIGAMWSLFVSSLLAVIGYAVAAIYPVRSAETTPVIIQEE